MVGLVVLLCYAAGGRLRPALPPPTAHGGIYAEAFAVYMVVFLGLGVVRAFIPANAAGIVLAGAAMLFSLAAGLIWPVLRGIPWRQVRQEVGLTAWADIPCVEAALGVAGYALVLPVFASVILVTSILVSIQRGQQLGDRPEEQFHPGGDPEHPSSSGWSIPIGGYWSRWRCWPRPGAVGRRDDVPRRPLPPSAQRDCSAGSGRQLLRQWRMVSFLFAVIHPQGFLAVPALMALAFGLTMLREWRGSLLPSMIVHGIHNGLTTFVLVQALSRIDAPPACSPGRSPENPGFAQGPVQTGRR